ncbi:glycine-rich cell wall structural protein 2-like isoform X3 [Populus alba x Populus x berolinensis]|nr:glycine-rich cell wall structural protein 2-like isoform X3 [Populus alba x Populus x berolinensis]
MDRYQRVEKPRNETPINENEIRITTQGRMRNYITYATTLFQEKGSDEISLKAMGRAINKTVMIAELIKRRIAGLHQNTSIGSNDITDMWEPLEEGLLPLETTRHVSVITVTLSKKELDTSSTGYQSPIPADQVKPLAEYDYEGEGGSPRRQGRGRGGRGIARGRVLLLAYGSFPPWTNSFPCHLCISFIISAFILGKNNSNGVVEHNGDGDRVGGRGYGGRDGGRGYGGRDGGRVYGGRDGGPGYGGRDGGDGYGGRDGGYGYGGRDGGRDGGYGYGGRDGGYGYGGRGRGRGRGRGYRGRGRGYGGGYMQQQSGGYNDYGGGAFVGQGSGRGRGQGSWAWAGVSDQDGPAQSAE